MKRLLLTPGPTPIPPDVLGAMGEPIIHHRTAEYKEIFKEANDNLHKVFKTQNDIFTFTSSGTGAMEASVVNICSPGDKVIVVRGGKFGERFSDISKFYGVEAIPLDIEWGTAPDPSAVEVLLKAKKKVKAVYMSLCETATATAYDVKAIAKVVAQTDAVLVVDAISGLAADELKTDEWGVDIVVAGSQKGLMLPPGLSFCSVSKKAWGLVESARCPRFYLCFKGMKKALDKGDTPFTPAITLVIGLRESLKIILADGLDKFMARNKTLADATRKAVKDLGLELFSKRPSDAVTAAKVPDGLDGEALIKDLRKKHGVWFAGGQAALKGKIFRIAHMGSIRPSDMREGFAALEDILKAMGHKFEPGSGLKELKKL
ncbi:MAG: alanine--glyoxylate aminotransferase family protein [Candidatus Omnitrophica bacterium]|nr:alanine--glyoxylate aminotransferase family protein [Candidatus Omnitrophota bacterium]